MIKAALDIGSNSCFFSLAEVNNGEIAKILFEDFVITSLGEGILSTGMLQEKNLAILYQFIEQISLKCQEHSFPLSNVKVAATEASRKAKNSSDMVNYLKNKFGLIVNIISADEEAQLSAMGVMAGHRGSEKFGIIDLGGASTELIFVNPRPFKIIQTVSIPLGSVLTTELVKTNNEEMIDARISDVLVDYKVEQLPYLGVAGTITTLAAALYCPNSFDETKIHEKTLSLVQLEEFIEENKNKEIESFAELYPVMGKRAKTLVGGSILLKLIMQKLNLASIKISNYGLRHGLLIK